MWMCRTNGTREKGKSDESLDFSRQYLRSFRGAARKFNIGIVPLYIEREGKNYRDGVDITPQDIFDYVGGGTACAARPPSIRETTSSVFRLAEGIDAVIHFNISSEMSSCYQNACAAAAECENVHVVGIAEPIHRQRASGAGGAERRRGRGPAAIAQRMRETAEKVEASFVIDTLFYLRRAGAARRSSRSGRTLLKLKPCIEVKKRQHGRRQKVPRQN